MDDKRQSLSSTVGVAEWCEAGTAQVLVCPVCGDADAKRALLSTRSLAPGRGTITLVECRACTNLFWDDQKSFAYEGGTGFPWSTDFYVEQGAGVDALIEPIARIPADRVRRYLEIGCGYGFSVDAAQRMFGWQGLGLDPSPLAQAGRDGLGLAIQTIYATTEIDLGGPFDLVYASEVIEHIDDPQAFLAICAAHLAPNGTLALTTPDADSVRPGVPMPELMLALSPGHHLILYSAEGLRHLLQAAGFPYVSVRSAGHRLVAYASRRPLDFDPAAPLDRGLYRRYLTQVLARDGLQLSLQRGLRYRLLKELTNSADYDEARVLLQVLSADIEATFGFSIEAPVPNQILDKVRQGTISGRFGAPWCLAGVLYCAGMIAQNGENAPAIASRCFDEAARVAIAFRQAYVAIGIDDGETGAIEQDAPRQAILSLCHVDPQAVADRLRRPASSGSAAWTEAAVLCLIDLGHLELAAVVADNPALRALSNGFIALHRRGDGKTALALFDQARVAGGTIAARAHDNFLPATHQAVLRAGRTKIDTLIAPILSSSEPLPPTKIFPILVSLVDLGHLDIAARLEPLVQGVDDWRLLNARGMLDLLHRRTPVSAAASFAEAWRRTLADGSDEAAEERCRIKYHEVVAQLKAGDLDGAAMAAADLLNSHAPAWVTQTAKADLKSLLADHPAVWARLAKLPASA
ncbi:MAG: hypothetical protein JWO51_3888 [Rhodospirillales bacterium]|nr:hypothetical protein [Rhodospirillales bacterium]